MASVYVHSGAAGAGTGADWANAYTTLSAALTAKAAGDDFWIAHDHAETQASAMTLTAPATVGSPNRIICANRVGSVPPISADLRTSATISTTGANNLTIGVGGDSYWYGISFRAGSAGSAANVTFALPNAATNGGFNSCSFVLNNTSIASRIAFGTAAIGSGTPTRFGWDSCSVTFGATAQGIVFRGGELIWKNTTSAIVGSVPTTLFIAIASGPGRVVLEGVDLSASGSGATLVGAYPARQDYVFKDCKLGSSVTVSATPTSANAHRVTFVRCDSGDTNYRNEIYDYTGTQTTETTIVRTGGASDGTTPIAWKFITTANSKRHLPFEALPISIWNETTGSAITLTVQGIWGGGAVPTNADIWMDVEYLGTSGFPLGSFASSGPADQLAAGTNLSAGSGTWGGSTTKFKLEKTITPQEKGPITIYVKAALPSSIFYLDPKISVT